MKKTTYILICLFLTECSLISDNSKSDNVSKTDKKKIEFIKTSSNYFGFWVSEEYIEAIRKTKSTKKASEMNVDEFYRIYNNSSIMFCNLHEGGANNILLMTTNSTGQVYSADTTQTYGSIEFKDNFLIVENKRFIKTDLEGNGLKQLVNRTLFTGKYIFQKDTISLNDNGEIFGLDSIVKYEVYLDYIDIGMQYDKINLQFKSLKTTQPFLYEFNEDTLLIYNQNCVEMDEENNNCNVVEKGKIFLKLVKE